jgi:hypothetical protein
MSDSDIVYVSTNVGVAAAFSLLLYNLEHGNKDKIPDCLARLAEAGFLVKFIGMPEYALARTKAKHAAMAKAAATKKKPSRARKTAKV